MAQRSVLPRLMRQIGNFPQLAGALATNLAEGACVTLIGATGARLLDAIVAGQRAAAGESFALCALFCLCLGLAILAKDHLFGVYLEGGVLKLKARTAEVLSRSRIAYLDSQHTGELSARTTQDLNTIADALRPVVILGVSNIILQLIPLGYMLYQDALLTGVMFCLVPVMTGLQFALSKPIATHRKRANAAVGSLLSVAADGFDAPETVRAYSLQGWLKARFDAAQDQLVDHTRREGRSLAALAPLSQLTGWIPQLVLLGVGGWFILLGRISLGQLTLFMALSRETLGLLTRLMDLVAGVRRMSAAAERVMDLWDAPCERSGGERALPQGPAPVLAFEGLRYGYDPARPVLQGVSGVIAPGEAVCLVGGSGSGKTTLARMCAGFYDPDEGDIRLLGRSVAKWDLQALREQIAYVAQEPFLFPGSLMDNIACGQADRTAVERALQAVGLGDLPGQLAQGLDTPLGEAGALLSGGQCQRVAIARALVRQSALLILDEATAALDPESERRVLAGILALPHRPAIVMISHRTAPMLAADAVWVLAGGRIVQAGPPEALRGQPGPFADLLAAAREEAVS